MTDEKGRLSNNNQNENNPEDQEDDDDEIIGDPGSPTPTSSSRSRKPVDNNSQQPTGSPSRKRGRMVYGDRYIPDRNGVNLQAAFSLVKDQASPTATSGAASSASASNNGTGGTNARRNHGEIGSQKVEEANKTFSTLLKAELFGNDVPNLDGKDGNNNNSGIGNSTSTATTTTGTTTTNANTTTATTGNTTTNDEFNITNNSSSTAITPTGGVGGTTSTHTNKTPPRSSRSAPVTPNKNLFKYKSPSRHPAGPAGAATSVADRIYTHEDVYSLSPVRMDSQRLLLSPRKQPRSVAKVPYKVLDAPELEDDFYLNLVDWGSKNLLAVGLRSAVYIWKAQTGGVQHLCDLPDNDKVTSVSWIKRGTHLAVGTNLGQVQIWDVDRAKRVRTMTGHDARANSLSWNEHILSSGSRDRTILHRDVRAPEHFIKRITGHRQEVCGLKWNPEENQLASGGNDNRLFVWDGLNDTPLHRFDHTAAVKALAWSPHQRGLLASGAGTMDRRIRFWSTINGTLINEVDTGSQVCNLAWSMNSNELVSTHGYSQNQVMVWKYPSMQQVAALTGHTYRVLYLAVSPDGKTVVTGAGDETLRFWNVFSDTTKNNTLRGSSSVLDAFQQIR